MTHLKRQKVPKNWPLNRKGTTFVVKGTNLKSGLPLLVVLRDILKIAKTRKEVKTALNSKFILVNSKPAKDEKNSMTLFDTLSIIPSKKHYRLIFNEKGKFGLEEIKENESLKKIAKTVDKKVLKGKRVQINLSDGRNYFSDIKCNVNDSVVVDFKNNKIEKCVPLKEGVKGNVFKGKHAGKTGIVKKIDKERKIVKLELNKDETINVLISFLIAVE